MQDGYRIDNPFYVRLKDRLDERENPTAISNECKQSSPFFPFPSVSVSPQIVWQRKIPAETFRLTTRYSCIKKEMCPKLLYAVLQEVPMSHKFASLIRTP